MATGASRAVLAVCISISVSTATLLAAGPAFAQDGAGTGAIEETTVTARKREEAAKDVPIAITALRADEIAAVTAGGADLTGLAARVPGVNVESSFGRTFPRFYIRGLGNTDFDINASQPVSLVYDEVVFENPVLKGFPIFDVAAIDVLKGPQGTLFGRNTPAGVVAFTSVKPTEEFDARIRAGVRSFEGVDLEAALGGKVADGISARLAVLVMHQNDWVDNAAPAAVRAAQDYGGYTEFAYRGQLRFQPNDKLDALINLHGRNFDGTGQLFRANVVTRGSNSLNSNFDRETVRYDGGAGNPQELRTFGGAFTLNYDFGPATLTSITGYETISSYFTRGDIDGGFGAVFLPTGGGPGVIAFPAETADGIDKHDQWSQEVRLASNAAGPLSWLVGAYYFRENLGIFTFNYNTLAPGQPINGEARQRQKTEAWALFASATYKPTDKLALTAGLRYSDDSKDFVASRRLSPFGAPALGPIRVSVGDEAVSWDVSAVYSVTDDVNLYGRVARGFRAPSIQGRVLFGDAVTTANSEFLTSYEVGMKGAFLDRTLRADLSIYRYDIDDQQLTAVGGGANFNRLVNASESEGYGAEADLEWAPSERLRFGAAVAYSATELKDPRLLTEVCGAPCTVRDPIVISGTGGRLARLQGNSFPNAPEWTANLTASYTQPLASGAELFATTDWAYKGETNFFLYDSVEFTEDGYWEGGLRAGWRNAAGKTEISVYGRNITDTEARTGGIDFNNLTGFVNAPRILGLEAKTRF